MRRLLSGVLATGCCVAIAAGCGENVITGPGAGTGTTTSQATQVQCPATPIPEPNFLSRPGREAKAWVIVTLSKSTSLEQIEQLLGNLKPEGQDSYVMQSYPDSGIVALEWEDVGLFRKDLPVVARRLHGEPRVGSLKSCPEDPTLTS